jgi:hypothetical protein
MCDALRQKFSEKIATERAHVHGGLLLHTQTKGNQLVSLSYVDMKWDL